LSLSHPLRILIVEDEILIALELESLLQDEGHEVVGIAASFEDAVALSESQRPDLAFVDIHLIDGPTGINVGRRLSGSGIAVLFMTANAKRIPEDCAGAKGVIGKPYSERGVRQALAYILAGDDAGPAKERSMTFVPFDGWRDEMEAPRA
jgi:CheY-like chemotaxis protein